MLHAVFVALRDHLESAVAGSGAVTAEPPAARLTEGPEAAAADRGLGIHLFHVAALDEGRSAEATEVRDAQGRVVARRPPVRRYRTRWMVWSWGPTAEVRLSLLDAALTALAEPQVLPLAVVAPGTAEHAQSDGPVDAEALARGGPVQMDAAPAAAPGELAGVFAGLGVPARPALEVVLTAGLALPAAPVAPPPTDVRVVTRPRNLGPAVR
ncbi:Pvc16 family protein [Streptomyces sp. NPDC059918]|uniref:Pvc16 family protein n=1 Tax=unclassified Streptomyces TaxID=2593676 RepID=UPI003653E324